MTTATSITVRVPLAIRHRPGKKTVVTPVAQGPAAVITRADPALVKALARAFRYQRMLDEGRYASITEIAAAERVERGYLGSLLRLTLLAPDIVEAILDGRQPAGAALPIVMRTTSAAWPSQRAAIAAHSEIVYIGQPQTSRTAAASAAEPGTVGRRRPPSPLRRRPEVV